jgi:hypothetical protein
MKNVEATSFSDDSMFEATDLITKREVVPVLNQLSTTP